MSTSTASNAPSARRRARAGNAATDANADAQNDIIAVELDASAGTLRFSKNGVDQGLAFNDLPRRTGFIGAVSLYGGGVTHSLKERLSWCSVGVPINSLYIYFKVHT